MLFHTLPRAHPGLAATWWALALVRALLPAVLIVVLQGNRVTEYGAHDELMSHGGTYAELYSIQAEAYR